MEYKIKQNDSTIVAEDIESFKSITFSKKKMTLFHVIKESFYSFIYTEGLGISFSEMKATFNILMLERAIQKRTNWKEIKLSKERFEEFISNLKE